MADASGENQTLQGTSSEQLGSDYTWLATSRFPIAHPSARNLNIPWDHNIADQIEHQMADDGHGVWGFVIYRTSYDNEEDWVEFLRRLRFQMDDVFEYYGGEDVLGQFEMTIMEGGRDRWEGASAAAVREDFLQWSFSAWRKEQRPTDGDEGQRLSVGRSQRYRFAVQVDAESLHSVVHEAPTPLELDTTANG